MGAGARACRNLELKYLKTDFWNDSSCYVRAMYVPEQSKVTIIQEKKEGVEGVLGDKQRRVAEGLTQESADIDDR